MIRIKYLKVRLIQILAESINFLFCFGKDSCKILCHARFNRRTADESLLKLFPGVTSCFLTYCAEGLDRDFDSARINELTWEPAPYRQANSAWLWHKPKALLNPRL